MIVANGPCCRFGQLLQPWANICGPPLVPSPVFDSYPFQASPTPSIDFINLDILHSNHHRKLSYSNPIILYSSSARWKETMESDNDLRNADDRIGANFQSSVLSGDPEFDFNSMYNTPHPRQSPHAAPSRQSSVVDNTAPMWPASQSTLATSVDKSGTRPIPSTAATVRDRGTMAATARGRGSSGAIRRRGGTSSVPTTRRRGLSTAISRGNL